MMIFLNHITLLNVTDTTDDNISNKLLRNFIRMKGQKPLEMLSYCYIRSFKKTPKRIKRGSQREHFHISVEEGCQLLFHVDELARVMHYLYTFLSLF